MDFLDNLQDRQRFTEQGDAITFESEVTKYVSTTTKIAILDHEKKRTFVLRKDGLPDAENQAREFFFEESDPCVGEALTILREKRSIMKSSVGFGLASLHLGFVCG